MSIFYVIVVIKRTTENLTLMEAAIHRCHVKGPVAVGGFFRGAAQEACVSGRKDVSSSKTAWTGGEAKAHTPEAAPLPTRAVC